MSGVPRRPMGWGWIAVYLAVAALLGAAGGAAIRLMMVGPNPSITAAIRPAFDGRKQIRILVLGEDRAAGGVRGRSDTIIVAAVDLENNTVRLVSIPRDTRTFFPRRDRYDKINAEYVHGGPNASVEAVEGLLGVGIDYYIETSIDGLKKTVDLLGGVEIDIEKDMRYTDRRGKLYINLKKGYRLLNGEQALGYVRFRHDRLGDIARIQRQQKFLRAIARKALTPEQLPRLPQIVNQVFENVNTNMSSKDLLTLAELARKIPEDQIEMTTLPGYPENIRGISYWIPDPDKVAQVVDDMLSFRPPLPPAADDATSAQDSQRLPSSN